MLMTTTTQTKFYFASTRLNLGRTIKPDDYPPDIHLGDVCYRKVDPAYYAWLRHKMASVKRTFDAGRLPQATWVTMRRRFNRLQEWAIDHYGKETLQAAIRDFDPDTYAPPVDRRPEPYLFPKTGDWRFSVPVDVASARKVDAIRDEARAKGWSDERLYRNRGRFTFPLGQDYGLVCFVDPDDDLGKITETHIEIILNRRGRRIVQRFANADVFPPRIKEAN
jgi:hypothetical protein